MRTRREKNRQLCWMYINLDEFVKEDDILREVDREVDTSFVNEELSKYYKNDDGGRPAEDPERIIRQLVCLILLGVRSERRLEEDTRCNLRIRWYCDYQLNEVIPDHSTISKVRKRYGEEAFDIVFSKVLEQCIDKGYMSGDTSLDRFSIEGKETPLTSRERAIILTREVIKVIEEGNKTDKILQKEGMKELSSSAKETIANSITDLARVDKRSKKRVINELMEMLKKEKREIKKEEKKNKRKRKKGIELLEDFKLKKGVRSKIEEVTKTDKIEEEEIKEVLKEGISDMPQSRCGGDAKFGHTSRIDKFFGYNGTFMIDHKEEIITSVGESDGDKGENFKEVYGKHKEKVGTPKSIRMDAEFDKPEIRKEIEEDKVVGYIAQRPPVNPQGLFNFANFEIKDGKLICPAGKEMMEIETKSGRKYGYLGIECNRCEIREKCTKSKDGIRRISLTYEDYQNYLKIKEFNGSDEYKSEMKKRMRIEAKIGHGKSYHHSGKMLYRNAKSRKIQLLLIATVLNIERMARIKIRERKRK